ncbi:hypothetical protein HanIR_Chr05g0246541 [Helianthus annuus]|nr:hypothetical protein HanIR_Chr05g0246541 [Helianthus annuus]
MVHSHNHLFIPPHIDTLTIITHLHTTPFVVTEHPPEKSHTKSGNKKLFRRICPSPEQWSRRMFTTGITRNRSDNRLIRLFGLSSTLARTFLQESATQSMELKDLARYGTFSRCTSFQGHPGFRECDSFLDKSQSLNCVYVMFKLFLFGKQCYGY